MNTFCKVVRLPTELNNELLSCIPAKRNNLAPIWTCFLCYHLLIVRKPFQLWRKKVLDEEDSQRLCCGIRVLVLNNHCENAPTIGRIRFPFNLGVFGQQTLIGEYKSNAKATYGSVETTYGSFIPHNEIHKAVDYHQIEFIPNEYCQPLDGNFAFVVLFRFYGETIITDWIEHLNTKLDDFMLDSVVDFEFEKNESFYLMKVLFTKNGILDGELHQFMGCLHGHIMEQLGSDKKYLFMKYKAQVDEALPKADAIAQSGDVVAAIKSLEPLEKESRLNCDMKSNQRILRHMVKLAFEARNWEALNEQIRLMCKKRSLIKMSIRAMVQDCCAMIDKMPDEKTKNELVEILRLVTEGKIYVEVERARLTKRMADKFEAEGEVDKARELIMELQVETYGSMEVNEKVKYLLHQMRLSITKGDFTRAAIISRKISTKFFEREGEEVEVMKLEFYKYMVDIGLHDESYLDVCKNFLAILNTSRIQADDAKKLEILKCAVFYVLLSQHDNEKWELLHRIHGMRELEQMPEHRALLGLFIRQELIFWSELLSGQYAAILDAQPAQFASVDPLLPNTDVFPNSEDGEKRKERLHHCVGEHNVRMIAKYYTRITFQRMAQLLEFDVEKMETFVCKMIVEGVIPEAKIHRPSKIIYMGAKKSSVDTLDQWGSNLRKLTGIMNQVSHLIIKEEMVHGMQDSMRED